LFNGTRLVFNTIRPHSDGEIVAENYGPIFTKQTLKERQRNLASRYWFKCECQACKENWPVLDKLSNKCRLKCSTDDCDENFSYPQNAKMLQVKCGKCKKSISLQISMNLVGEAEELFRQGAEAMDVNMTNFLN
jgi:hypothetical protein